MKVFFFLLIIWNISYSQTIELLVAANAKFFFKNVIESYNEKYPNELINVEYDSSGNLTKKIINGKAYDLFLAANYAYPQKLYDLGKAVTKPKLYATGSLILLIAKHDGLKTKKIMILEDPTIKEITIANKQKAPYGVAAIEALKNANLYSKVEKKLFYSTDASNIIGDVLWYGHAGILPKSSVSYLPRGYNKEGENWLEINQSLYTPLKQYFVFSESGVKKTIAKKFVDFLLSKDGQKIFYEYGYK